MNNTINQHLKPSHYYLVDLENVGLKGLNGLRLPGEESYIRIFLSPSAHMANADVRADILASKAKIDTFYCGTVAKNALDFELAAFFGAALEREDTVRISIISNDNGYKALLEYAKRVKKEASIYRAGSILEAYVAAREHFEKEEYHLVKCEKVDFKHIMNALKEKKISESLADEMKKEILQLLVGEIENDVIQSVFETVVNKENTPRQIYLWLLKTLGREKGNMAYRIVKNYAEKRQRREEINDTNKCT